MELCGVGISRHERDRLGRVEKELVLWSTGGQQRLHHQHMVGTIGWLTRQQLTDVRQCCGRLLELKDHCRGGE